MAQLKQCANGHYFDPNMYSSCPYCSGASVSLDRSVSSYDIKTSTPDVTAFPGTVSEEFGVGGSATVSPIDFSGVGNVTMPPSDTFSIDNIPATKPVNLIRKPGRAPAGQGSEAEAAPSEPDMPLRSVVGWLVAVEGPYLGKSFELHQAYNYIGREKGDIILNKDTYISTEKNAWVMYSAKNNRFKFGAGESTNVVYVNDDELSANSSVPLAAYDLIEIGSSKFRFIPFCSEQFQW